MGRDGHMIRCVRGDMRAVQLGPQPVELGSVP
jgi:hypothetical protein